MPGRAYPGACAPLRPVRSLLETRRDSSRRIVMQRTSLVHLGLGLGLALAGCQSDADTSPPTDSDSSASTQFNDQALECTGDAEDCAAQCLDAAGIDLGALQACGAELRSCVQANPHDAAACIETAKSCLGGDGAGSGQGLGECLSTCSADFGDCVPEPPMDPPAPGDLDGLLACVQAAGECLGGCAQQISACEPPKLDCDPAGFEALAACFEAAQGDRAALAACVH